MTDDMYQGYTNRETWAFNLHWQSDEPLYRRSLVLAGAYLREHPEASDREVGQVVVDYWRDVADPDRAWIELTVCRMAREVGSWWRVDAAG